MNPTFRAFQHRNFRLFFLGFAISMLGSWMQVLAQSWLVWRLTHSTVWLGLIGAMPQLPSLILGPFGGVIVDRHFKRSVLVVTQLGLGLSAAALAIVTLTGQVTPEIILGIAVVSGIFVAIDTPARLSFAQDLVGKEDIGNAVALNSTTFNAARLVGPSIAGFLVPVIGEGGIFAVNAVSFLGLIATLFMMKNLPQSPGNSAPVRQQLREAFDYVRGSPLHRTLMLNVMIYAVVGFSYVPLMPLVADRILDVGVEGLGVLTGAIGLGALAGGLRQATLPPGAKRGFTVIVGAISLAVFVGGFALSHWYWFSLAMLFGAGFSFVNMLASTNTLLQQHSPDHLRGRVLGFYTTAFLGFLPVGSLLAGLLAAWIGASITMLGFAVLCLIAVSFVLAREPRLRAV
ncbi:MFS transporter [candidate division KSB1 bacterium]|nr:MFS transporter [candidate division KSB1 bacterium]